MSTRQLVHLLPLAALVGLLLAARSAPRDGLTLVRSARDGRPTILADVWPGPRGQGPKRAPRFVPVAAKAHPGFKLKWKTKVGLTHYRHTILLEGGKIVLGTNGTSYAGKNEPDDAVYVLDGKSGRVLRRISHPGRGDRDVNGVASDGRHVYFGTDGKEVYKYTLEGQLVWRSAVDHHVEGAPALGDLDGDGTPDVVVGTEAGTLYALGGKTGKPLWKATTGAHPDYGARGFWASPALGDLDGDGTPDVVIGARDGKLTAYSGKRGVALWSYRTDSGIHASATLTDLDGDGKLDVLGATSYSKVFALAGKTGAELWSQSLSQPTGGIEGLFSSPVPAQLGGTWCALIGTAWWKANEALYCVASDRVVFRFGVAQGKISSSAVVADLVPGGTPEIAFGGEDGALRVLSATGAELWRAPTGGPIECTPFIGDVDGDGQLEVLAASGDGYLYAYATPSRGPVIVGKFRVDNANTGLVAAPGRSLRERLKLK